MKLLFGPVIILAVGVVAPIVGISISPSNGPRKGKFLGFSPDEMLMDVFDDMDDPLPAVVRPKEPEKSSRGKSNNLARLTTTRSVKMNETKLNGFEKSVKSSAGAVFVHSNPVNFHEVVTMTTTAATTRTTTARPSVNFTSPAGGASATATPAPSTPETIILYEGDEYKRPIQYQPGVNNSEHIKIFWNSVGEAVENVPFLPIQLNVPDMIAAMANFLVNYFPFINRFSNPNHPRVPYVANQTSTHPHRVNYYKTYELPGPLGTQLYRSDYIGKTHDKADKKRRKNKRKSEKRKGNSQKSSPVKKIFQIPGLSKTTPPPMEDSKLWASLGPDQKETFKLKNMPISRKRIRVADREIFNFKNSDISNSPIMILNVPQRPITHYKIVHQELRDRTSRPGNMQQQNQSQQQSSTTSSSSSFSSGKSRRKLTTENNNTNNNNNNNNNINNKRKRSSKRSGRLDPEWIGQETGNRPVTVS